MHGCFGNLRVWKFGEDNNNYYILLWSISKDIRHGSMSNIYGINS